MKTRRHGQRVQSRKGDQSRKGTRSRKARGGARKRHSNVGKLLPPLDVRDSSALKGLMKRIESGPLTIVLVYADWCGHCHAMRPHFDAASNAPGRTVQSVSVNETMLGKVNESIQSMNAAAQPLEADAYPTIMVVDNKGNKVSDIAPEKNTAALTKVMTTPTGPPNAKEAAEIEEAEEAAKDAPAEEAVEGSEPLGLNAYKGEDRLLGSTASAKRLKVIDPTMKGGLRGGTLLSALSQSVYTLAPAAVLLATAAQVMKRSKSLKRAKRSKSLGTRRTRR